jgi:uncharacterized protein YggU (UPF0235/DUF167 family)
MEQDLVTASITVVKADGPGWLVIAETLDQGRYRVVRELFGEEPFTAEILRFIDRLPERWAAIEGAEVTLKRTSDQRHLSPKRAARQAAREVAEARDPGRFQPTKAMQIKSAEFDLAKAAGQARRELDLTVWVRFGKKKATVLDELHHGHQVVEIPGYASESESNQQVIVTLARYFGTDPSQVGLLHGFVGPQKSFRIRMRA